MEEKYENAEEQVCKLTAKLEKLWQRYKSATQEVGDLQREIQNEREDLLETIRLRWMAQVVGFGKLVLKGGKLIGVFHDEEGSDYYRGIRFQRVLDFMQRNPKGVQMYQRNNALRLRVEPVEDLEAAMGILRRLSGAPASTKVATAGPGPQGPGEVAAEED